MASVLFPASSMTQVAAVASPFNCRWIERDSAGRLGEFSYAMCVRPGYPRVVSEEECAHCPRWQERQCRAPAVRRPG
jgi:hypothetical protein